MGVFIVLILIVCVIICFKDGKKQTGEIQTTKSQWEKYIKSKQIIVDKSYEFIYTPDIVEHLREYKFIVDKTNKNIHIFNGKYLTYYTIPFSEISECEIVDDSKIMGQIGSAIGGYLVAGEAGAVVGAMSASEFCKDYKIIIYCKNIDNPKITLWLLDQKTNRDTYGYKAAKAFAENVLASIKAIVSIGEFDRTININEHKNISYDEQKEQLENTRKLYDNGLITEEEFEAKRKQIIGI